MNIGGCCSELDSPSNFGATRNNLWDPSNNKKKNKKTEKYGFGGLKSSTRFVLIEF